MGVPWGTMSPMALKVRDILASGPLTVEEIRSRVPEEERTGVTPAVRELRNKCFITRRGIQPRGPSLIQWRLVR